jgi:hypothetical protein
MGNMKLLCGLMLLAGISISGVAFAAGGHGGSGHGHVGVGLYFGIPYPYQYYPSPYYYYPYPYPYYPPVMVQPSQPPVYIEQGEAQSVPQQATVAPENYYWYHCDKPEGYYPYIKECPSGWQKVSPTPPPQP